MIVYVRWRSCLRGINHSSCLTGVTHLMQAFTHTCTTLTGGQFRSSHQQGTVPAHDSRQAEGAARGCASCVYVYVNLHMCVCLPACLYVCTHRLGSSSKPFVPETTIESALMYIHTIQSVLMYIHTIQSALLVYIHTHVFVCARCAAVCPLERRSETS